MRTTAKIVLALLVALIGYVAYIFHSRFGFFYTDTYLPQGRCKLLQSQPGAEDLVVFGGQVLSAFLDRGHFARNPQQRLLPLKSVQNYAGIMAFDPATGATKVIPIEGFPETSTFHPVGIHGTPKADGKGLTLYVISANYLKAQDVVEVFNVRTDEKGSFSAKYVKTVRFVGKYFEQLNDLYVFPDGKSFYITTWLPEPGLTSKGESHGMKNLVRMILTQHTDLLLCHVAGENVATCTVQDHGHMMNGVASDEKGHLFAADTMASIINYYEIKPDRTLTKVSTIKLAGLGADNLVYDQGTLLAGVSRVRDHMTGGHKLIPGGVVQLFKENGEWHSRTLLMQNEISILSTAVRVGEKYVMGSAFGNKILVCDRQQLSS